MHDTDLTSLGHAAATYQRDPRLLSVALKGVQAKCQLRLNGIPYFRAADFVEAVKLLAEWDAGDQQRAAEAAANA